MRPHRAAAPTGLVLAAAVLLPQSPAQAAGTVTATYEPANKVLRVTGDGEANIIAVGRNPAGLVSVSNGAVAVDVAGGPVSVAGISTVVVATGSGDDVVRIDETNGAMPRSTQFLGSGSDHGTGGSGGDLLSGDLGRDVLEGKAGDDNVFGGGDGDFLRGGDGIDTVIGQSGADELTWAPGDDDDTMVGDAGLDLVRVDASSGPNVIDVRPDPAAASTTRVSGVDATVKASAETLEVAGNGGSDTVVVSPGAGQPGRPQLRLLGGDGTDVLLGADGDEELLGGDGTDVLHGGGGSDTLQGFLGDDALIGGPGPDRVDGEGGADRVQWFAGDGDDDVRGGEGDDVLTVTNGATPDTVGVVAASGGRVQVRSLGQFALHSDTEQVEVRGGAANDVLSVGVGIGLLARVTLDGGLGGDRLDGDDTGNKLLGGEGDDLLFGEGGDDALDGGVGNDQLVGNAGDDLESGGDGDDVLFGNEGEDNLDGGAGFDFLRGGSGFDVGFDGEDVASVP